MRAVCAKEFEAHWQCLDKNNQVRILSLLVVFNILAHLFMFPPIALACLNLCVIRNSTPVGRKSDR
jgi:hypothetical protein